MKLCVCMDSFKDCCSATELNSIIEQWLRKNVPSITQIEVVPLSDGGNGFLDSIGTYYSNHTSQTITTKHPHSKYSSTTIQSNYFTFEDDNLGKCAVMEMAKTSGLELISLEDRNPYETSTVGLGQMIQHALQQQCKKIILGIGGSCTNDAGLGALHQIGLSLCCNNGVHNYEPEIFYGKHLLELETIDTTAFREEFKRKYGQVKIDIACDVTNPFVGPHGAVYTFSKQKGATPEQQIHLEAGMKQVAHCIDKELLDENSNKGYGAAGGIAGTFSKLLPEQVSLKRGIQLVVELLQVKQKIESSDLIITGEGSFDYQTKHGKTVSIIQELCRDLHKPILILCGKTDLINRDQLQNTTILCLTDSFSSDEAMQHPKSCIEYYLNEFFSKFSA